MIVVNSTVHRLVLKAQLEGTTYLRQLSPKDESTSCAAYSRGH
jgi:hypothetical protein